MVNTLKVDIIGTYPPPVGGTSVHLQRLYESCKKDGIKSVVYDTASRFKKMPCEDNEVIQVNNYMKFFIKYLFNRRAQIIHSHTHGWKERAMLTFKARLCRQKVIFTFHSFRDEKSEMTLIEKICALYAIKRAHYYIATNSIVKEKLISWGVSKKLISEVSPFIYPDIKKSNVLDGEIISFVKEFDFIICANGSNNDKYKGSDIYGLDMCIELHSVLQERYNCGFVYVLTKTTDISYLNEMKERISSKRIKNSFLIVEKPVDFLELLKVSKLFVRPSCTDSRPLSVEESIALGCPVVASDVCWHPESSILFEGRNQEYFNRKVKYVLENYDEVKKKVLKDRVVDGIDKIYKIYKKLLK